MDFDIAAVKNAGLQMLLFLLQLTELASVLGIIFVVLTIPAHFVGLTAERCPVCRCGRALLQFLATHPFRS